jgi:hypothetical protein
MRTVLGVIACLLYTWRVYDPKAAYIAFYDASNWLTGWLFDGGGFTGVLRNIVNLVLVDQAEGFLLGLVFFAALSGPVWLVRRSAGWCWRKGRGLWHRPAASALASDLQSDKDEPLVLRSPVAQGGPGGSEPALPEARKQ